MPETEIPPALRGDIYLQWIQSVAEAGQGNSESNGRKAVPSERGSSYAAGLWTQGQLRAVCDSEIGNPIF